MKKKRGLNININLSNRWIYFLITLGILAIVGVSVYAATYSPSGAGHPITEISTCGANQILKMNSAGTAWTCGTDVDTDTDYCSGGSCEGSLSVPGSLVGSTVGSVLGQFLSVNGAITIGGTGQKVNVPGALTADHGRTSVYFATAYCTTSALTTASSCTTRGCDSYGHYYDCDGSCDSSRARTCTNNFVGFLV